MVQILPALPSFGGGFGQGFGEGLASGLTGAIEQYQAKKAEEKKVSGIQNWLKEHGKQFSPEQQNIIAGIALEKIPEKLGMGLLADLAAKQNMQQMTEGGPVASGIPSLEQIQAVSAFSPERGRTLQEERKAQIKAGTAREAQLLPIQEKASEHLTAANNQMQALNTQLAAVQSGDVGVLSKANFSNWLKKHGYDTLANAVQSEGGAAFTTAGKQIFAGAKNIFGAKVSNYETGIFEQMMPLVGRNKDVNELVVKSLMVPALVEQEQNRYKLQLIEADPNISPVRLNNAVFRHMQEYEEQLYADWQDTLNKALGSSGIKPAGQATEKRRSLDDIFGSAPL